MIDKATAIPAICRRVDKLPENHAIDLRTYKRNRSVVIVRKPGGMLGIIENGYDQAEFEIPEARLRKTLKTLFAREFPRSTKLRLYELGEFSGDKAALARKKI